ncbi:methyl-accepting chemotaxis protein [Paenibacillus sp. NEAU-GSW1]|uniref:methyl-accepting chemotaxis protein n=1 Tax=Paenibacillus sp. NEAU-GSW1 TaxID=2682486 RepID=UPI0012E2100A|nr:HAMP domain-containing methyl-accepting chemotaxis protein [Paenibacillus sp. NEAU-GSW1]MUT64656.1 HAMP domain-containing protein [Paenibacillus sp. NEAU-GSW1]
MMTLVLKPFTAIISRLKYAQKFLLLSVLFLIPLAMLLSIWLSELQEEITIAEEEQVGVAYIHSLMPLIIHIQEHRGHANGLLNGNSASEAKLSETEQKIAADIEQIKKANAAASGTLNNDELWSQIVKDWNDLQASTKSLKVKESFDQHSALIQNVLNLATNAADQSGLSLDPEIDSFYLMDIMVNRLPLIVELSGKARGQGNGILIKQFMTPDEKIELTVEKNRIEESLRGLERSLATVSETNASLVKPLESLGQQNVDSIKLYLNTLENTILNTPSLSADASQYFAEGTKTIEISTQLFNGVTAELDRLLDERKAAVSSERSQMMTVIGIILLLVLLFYLAFYRNVRSTIQVLQTGAARFAAGDLSDRLNLQTKDELRHVGSSFNEMADALNALLRRNQEISEQVAASSQQLSAVSEESTTVMEQIAHSVNTISEGADMQQRTLEENAITMNEMATVITKIADAASDVSDAASDASNDAKLGEEKLQLSNSQMNRIQEAVQQSNELVLKLNEHSNEIQTILSVIMSISSQTHILSLNANIEAAKAGEQGRGFMVVAKEVGKLAEQTTSSTKSIAALIEDIRNVVDEVVGSMKETTLVTEQGLETNQAAVQTLGSVLNAMKLVAEQIQEVSAAAEQASASTEQVTAAYSEMVKISKQAADETRTMAAAAEEQLSSMEEVSSSSEMLSSSAQQLQDELGKFILRKK